MRVWGFLKVKNERLTGHLPRALANLAEIADGGVLCDDDSCDGTFDALLEFATARKGWLVMSTKGRPELQGMANELRCKDEMMQQLHKLAADNPPGWVHWADADEEVRDVAALKREMESRPSAPGLKMHYTQLWRSEHWARTDQGFDDGVFLKCWRYRPDLSFVAKTGTHHQQYPAQLDYAACPTISVETIHHGNANTPALVRKATQYSGGAGGVDRHIAFGHSPAESMATHRGFDVPKWSAPNPTYRYVGSSYDTGNPPPMPKPFTLDEIRNIRALGNLRRTPGLFCVVVPAYNRAATLTKALESLQAQTYTMWCALVVDDGSTDGTPALMREWQEREPRVFYLRTEQNRGGVAANELGMDCAVEFAEYWSRLGSDDWFGPMKLELDAKALRDHAACYGLYTVYRPQPIHGRPAGFGEICNPPMVPKEISAALLAGRYFVSWANIAVRTEVLRAVKAKFGTVMDPRLRNCDDFITNCRIASMGYEFVWRGPEGVDGTPVPLGKAWDSQRANTTLEAVWTQAPEGGASSPESAAVLARDEALTRQLIAELRR